MAKDMSYVFSYFMMEKIVWFVQELKICLLEYIAS